MNAARSADPDLAPTEAASLERAGGSDEAILREWTVHLLRREPKRAVVILTSLLFVLCVAWLLFHSPFLMLAGAFMVLSAASEFLFPIRYRLTTRKAAAHWGAARFEIEWGAVKRLLEAEGAVKLSPLPKASRLDHYRGVTLRFAPEGEPGSRADVLEIVEASVRQARERAAAK
jgi:hypothetical protein